MKTQIFIDSLSHSTYSSDDFNIANVIVNAKKSEYHVRSDNANVKFHINSVDHYIKHRFWNLKKEYVFRFV